MPEAYKKRHCSGDALKEPLSGDGKKVGESPAADQTDSDEDMPLSHVKQKKVYKSVALLKLVSVLLSSLQFKIS